MDALIGLITLGDWWSVVIRFALALPVVGDVLLHTAVFLWLFWGLYVLVMGVYRAHLSGRLSRAGYVLGAPFVVIGYAVDLFANVFVASVFFLELPRERLVTDRLQRHIRRPTSAWRTRMATWVCDHLLDIFDPTGNHC